MTPEDIMKAVLFFLTVAGSGWAIWWKIDAKVEKVEGAASKKIAAAEEKANKNAADLAEHKLHAAETFATKAGMQEQTAQLLRAIEGVGNRIDGLHERLDRAFERTTRAAG
ncbi:hypothetical protein [Rhizobium leucaenae]|uniref:hypothetical protein n=1 Tax=Rhizobium leucaenae TaxID=29450 RepID=UPI00160CFCAC|nr:hypothetical protein [Rhizobium leucaenae]MBB6304694.1 hypothetical protein [Rhizobium leucaenae]